VSLLSNNVKGERSAGVMLTFGSPRIVSGLRVALDVIETGVHIYGTRARKFTRLPEDAELLAQLIASGVRERE